jgi:hypothetical protein
MGHGPPYRFCNLQSLAGDAKELFTQPPADSLGFYLLSTNGPIHCPMPDIVLLPSNADQIVATTTSSR